MDDFRHHWTLGRDVLLFVGGLIGTFHETVVVDNPDYELLVLFAGMMGLTFVFRRDAPPAANPADRHDDGADWRKKPIKDVFREPWVKAAAR